MSVFIMLLALMLPACSGAGSETPPWLLGRWQVAYNPNQDDSDVLLFQPGGKVRIEMEDGRALPGYFQVQQDKLVLLIQIGQRNIETQFQISPAKDRLVFSNGAYYMKFNDEGDTSH
jgi:hypothetical protein